MCPQTVIETWTCYWCRCQLQKLEKNATLAGTKLGFMHRSILAWFSYRFRALDYMMAESSRETFSVYDWRKN